MKVYSKFRGRYLDFPLQFDHGINHTNQDTVTFKIESETDRHILLELIDNLNFSAQLKKDNETTNK